MGATGFEGEGDRHRRALDAAIDAVLGGGEEPATGELSALDTVCSCFGLSAFERKVLLLAAAVELRPATPPPTFAHAFATFDDAHWSAATPCLPLSVRKRRPDCRNGPASCTSS